MGVVEVEPPVGSPVHGAEGFTGRRPVVAPVLKLRGSCRWTVVATPPACESAGGLRWKEGERWEAPMVREAEEGEGEVGSTDGEGRRSGG